MKDGLVVGDISDYQPADITAQLVDSEAGRRIDLMLGGGRASWLPRNQTEADTRRVRGRELFGRDLVSGLFCPFCSLFILSVTVSGGTTTHTTGTVSGGTTG